MEETKLYQVVDSVEKLEDVYRSPKWLSRKQAWASSRTK